jgi:hypothetical protein
MKKQADTRLFLVLPFFQRLCFCRFPFFIFIADIFFRLSALTAVFLRIGVFVLQT